MPSTDPDTWEPENAKNRLTQTVESETSEISIPQTYEPLKASATKSSSLSAISYNSSDGEDSDDDDIPMPKTRRGPTVTEELDHQLIIEDIFTNSLPNLALISAPVTPRTPESITKPAVGVEVSDMFRIDLSRMQTITSETSTSWSATDVDEPSFPSVVYKPKLTSIASDGAENLEHLEWELTESPRNYFDDRPETLPPLDLSAGRANTPDSDDMLENDLTSFFNMCMQGDVVGIDELLSGMDEGDALEFVEMENPRLHVTGFGMACQYGQLEVLQLLVERYHADVNCGHCVLDSVRRTKRSSPLHHGISSRRSKRKLEIIKFLVRHGADVNCIGERGLTPLMEAVHQQRQDLVLELLQHPTTNVNAKSFPREATALNMALSKRSTRESLQILRLILVFGADVGHRLNERDDVVAVSEYEVDMLQLRLLISFGYDPRLSEHVHYREWPSDLSGMAFVSAVCLSEEKKVFSKNIQWFTNKFDRKTCQV